MELAPGAPQLPRRGEAGPFGHAFHVEAGLAQQFLGRALGASAASSVQEE